VELPRRINGAVPVGSHGRRRTRQSCRVMPVSWRGVRLIRRRGAGFFPAAAKHHFDVSHQGVQIFSRPFDISVNAAGRDEISSFPVGDETPYTRKETICPAAPSYEKHTKNKGACSTDLGSSLKMTCRAFQTSVENLPGTSRFTPHPSVTTI